MLLSLLWTLLFLSLALPQEMPSAQQQPVVEAEKLDLCIAYVGDEASPRGKEFLALLKSNFREVISTSASAMASPAEAEKIFAPVDVVVVDQNLTGRLPAGYAKPMVLISGPGVQTAESLGAKLDWL